MREQTVNSAPALDLGRSPITPTPSDTSIERSIVLAETLILPPEAVTETFAILATRGSGKSATAHRLVEQLYHAGLPTVVIDVKGDWWGIRSSADGAGATGCLCPGFTTGGLPHGMTKHMDGLDAHDDELCPNPGCEHDLLRHGGVDFDGQPYGCWACPCEVNELPASSLFEIRIDVAAADALSTPDVTAAHGTELPLRGGWLARLQPTGQGAVTMTIWQRDGLQFRSGSLDTNDGVWAALSRYEAAEFATTITDCWWHENECDPDHEYRMRLIADA